MNIFPLANRRPKSIHIAAVFAFAFLLHSCSSAEISSFAWKSASGENLPFAQKADFPKGEENIFSLARPKNSYTLRKPLRIGRGFMVAVSMTVKQENILVSLSLSADTKNAGQEVRFAARPGATVFYLSIPAASAVRMLSVNVAAPANPAADAKEDTPLVELDSVSILPAFRGYERKVRGGYRISDGITIDRKGASANLWELENPFSGQDAAEKEKGLSTALVIRYAKRADADIVIEAGRKIIANGASAKKEFVIPSSVFADASSQARMTILVPDEIQLEAAYIEALPQEIVSRVDPGVVLLQPLLSEREDFAWYRWDLLPDVLMFDFRNYAVQDAYLKRLAFFVEKRGFVGRLAKDEEIASLHGWNAHDYKAEDLAKFFTAAGKSDFPLSAEELRLRDFLVEKGLLTKKGNGFGSRNGAIISITQESDSYLRHRFLTHESSHAVYFTDASYRNFCVSLWNGMSKEEKWFWVLYFGWMNYDTNSASLMANEVQAYLLQQAPKNAGEYFTKTLPERLLENHPELEAPIALYMEKYGLEFEKKARMLDEWLKSTYGFGAGTTFFLD